jgi:hypothetical protein
LKEHDEPDEVEAIGEPVEDEQTEEPGAIEAIDETEEPAEVLVNVKEVSIGEVDEVDISRRRSSDVEDDRPTVASHSDDEGILPARSDGDVRSRLGSQREATVEDLEQQRVAVTA